MKIVADNKIPFLKGVLEPYAEVSYYPASEINSDVVKDADALIIRTRTKCDASLLSNSKVKFIATATIGFDHIDTEFCKKNDIAWANAPGCNSSSVVQYIASTFVYLSKKYNFNFSEKTLGIIGVGNVGSKVKKLADELGMTVLLNDPPRKRKEGKQDFVSLKEIQEKADIITFHVPLNRNGKDKTHHLADRNFFKNIKSGTIIINSSRGEVVETSAIKKALKDKTVMAAVLDVWEHEPNIDIELLNMVELGTPHIAGYSVDGKAMGTAMSVQAVSKFFKLGLNNWFPNNIPSVQNNSVKIDCNNKSYQQVINEAIITTYDITKDSVLLKKYPNNFEKQRENYPIRREFKAFHIELINEKGKIKEKLKTLGFETT